MTIHIDIAQSKATLAEVVDLVERGESVVIDRAGESLGEFVLEPPPTPLARAKAKHRFIGALAHLGPLTAEEANMFLGPDPEFQAAARSEDEDHLYK